MSPTSGFRIVFSVGALFFTLLHTAFPAHAVIYVKTDATGANDGTSWTNAFTDLQDALATATSGDTIWTAAGTYTPTSGTDRTVSFRLVSGVGLYGGFSGIETSLGERDVAANPTVLSGDLGVPDDYTDDSFHVVRGDSVDSSAVLDGFTVTAGAATDITVPHSDGGGLFVEYGSPTIQNTTVTSNISVGRGGGAFIGHNSSPTFANVTFSGNAGPFGGGLYVHTGLSHVATFSDVTFLSNVSTQYGGAVYTWSSEPVFLDAAFENNTAALSGGGMEVRDGGIVLTRVQFTGNQAPKGGGVLLSGGMTCTDVVFDGNIATTYGGAMGISYVDASASISGVTFTNNTAPMGGAIYLDEFSGTIDSCLFTNNTADQGGAVYRKLWISSSPTIMRSTFDSNSAGTGGAVYNRYSADFTAVTFVGNSATMDGGAMYSDDGTQAISSCLFQDNTSGGNGAAIYNAFVNPVITSTTMVRNRASGEGGAIFNDQGAPVIVNSIFWGDSAAVGSEIRNVYGGMPTVSYSDIESSGGSGVGWDASIGADGGHNLDADPLFVDPVAGDYHLSAGSPCIEQGDNNTPALPTIDVEGNPRIAGLIVDMGAYESPFYCPAGNVLYVDAGAMAPGNGASWGQAYPTLTDAFAMVDLCPNVTEIWVAAGTYKPTAGNDRTATFTLRNGLSVYGGFTGNEVTAGERKPGLNLTVLSGDVGVPGTGDNVYHVLDGSGTDSSAVLDGFVVSDGEAGGAYPYDRGGGLVNLNGSPAVANVVFTHNMSLNGGAVANNIGSSPRFANVVFFDNLAVSTGGAVSNTASDPIFINASFSKNSATFGGAISDSGSDPILVNSILWSDSAAVGPEIYNVSGSAPVVSYSIVEGSGGSGGGWDTAIGIDGGGNLDADPAFVDDGAGDLHLGPTSPAIDGGDSSALDGVATDLDGKPRIIGVSVDMGAYEYDPGPTAVWGEDATTALGAHIRSVSPNPFNPTVTVALELDRRRAIRITVYDVLGRRVATIFNGVKEAGLLEVEWTAVSDSGNGVATGVYIVVVESNGWKDSRKVILVK